ncbi:uncharacterized protein LOC105421129 [Amborella trichopoda]|uniref:uncharacterized protein LOC105421129 n=1 Tax=Amborella trichopoda TaxID=13333 RepID=UPI0005D451F8|nr:uncharacterized protein LOC105421129 [Amborella trichopoda]|eukprot:XP_011625663.1 uncharacterized protein LOC105421129 [Amborella trichopoda]
MNILSWNVRGLGDLNHKKDVRFLVSRFKPTVLILQKTKLLSPTIFGVREVWGLGFVDFLGVDYVGAFVGQWILWDPTVLQSFCSAKKDNFLMAGFVGPGIDFHWGLLNVYGPHALPQKELFINDISTFIRSFSFPICLGGDFNFIRWLDESSYGGPITSSMRMFNRFIESHALLDLPISGISFTWTNGSASNLSMSKLDRFLVFAEWSEFFPLAAELRRIDEMYWKQSSRIKWLKESDLNTKFFHAIANARRCQNDVSRLLIN